MNKKGFTLIELLVVIGILGILMGVVVVAVNPARQFAQARNAQRWSNVNTLLNAVGQYYVDNGVLPAGVSALAVDTATEICADGVIAATCTTASLVLLDTVVTPDFIVDIPADPLCPTACATSGAGYTITKLAGDRVTVSAPDAELTETVSVTR